MSHENSRRSSLKKIAAGVGVLASPGLAFSQSQSKEPIRIAAIYALSGPAGLQGNSIMMGAKIAAEQWNRQGGVLGRKIEVVVRDDKASPAESALVGREVLGSGIKFIVGGMITAPALAIVNMLDEHDAVFVLTGSSIMALTHESYNPRDYRISPNGRMNLYASAKVMAEVHPEITVWGGVVPDNLFGIDNYKLYCGALKKYYKEMHNKEVTTLDPVLHAFGATDYKVQIARVMSSPAQGIQAGMIGADFVTFMSQAKQQGLYNKVKVYLDAGQGVNSAKSLGANVPPELWTNTPWYADAKNTNAAAKALIKDYAAMTGDKTTPDSALFYGYAGMTALLTAIKQANSTEPALVRVGLERMSFEAPNGQLSMRRDDHQAVTNVQVLCMVPKKGDPPWEVSKVYTVRGEDVIEPAGPGQKFVIPS
jgi:branched-chain amino acid transport system substrate-binding protein